MQVIPNVKGDTLVQFAKTHIEPGTTISSDAYRSYNILSKEYVHQPVKFNAKDNLRSFEMDAHDNFQREAFIGRTFHGLDPRHPQSFLNEFCFRTNHRWFEGQLFNRLLSAWVGSSTLTFCELTSRV